MRTTFALALGILALASTIGCGGESKPGGSPTGVAIDPKSPVGTWVLDTKPIVEMLKTMSGAMKQMTDMMPEGPEKAAKVKEFEAKMADVGKMKAEITLNKDGTANFENDMPGDPHETGTGSWTQSGDAVTIVMKTKNGKPAEGNSAEPKTVTFKDNKLVFSEGGMTMTFNRK